MSGYLLDKPSITALADITRRYLREPRKTTGAEGRCIFPEEILYAKITASATAINGGIRYRYTIQIGHWNMSSSPTSGGVWVNDSGSTTYTAFSSAEDMNTFSSGTGTIGTGNSSVAQSDGTIGTTSCKLKPLPSGGYVLVKLRGYNGDTPYFTILNAMNSAQ
jgi:hypothetical protein